MRLKKIHRDIVAFATAELGRYMELKGYSVISPPSMHFWIDSILRVILRARYPQELVNFTTLPMTGNDGMFTVNLQSMPGESLTMLLVQVPSDGGECKVVFKKDYEPANMPHTTPMPKVGQV